ncbi:hypothetical protein CPB97_005061 [Podila verticillata]|nr:hypothetical protein CPB97_005061 [Podila verticillata]
MPFCGSEALFEERVLVRTKDYVTIISPPAKVPAAISRIEPGYLEVMDQVPCRSPSLWKDDTIHAAISPHLSNQYALIGDKGSISIWTTPRNNVAQDSQSESSSASGSYDSDGDANNDRIGTRRKKQLLLQKRHQAAAAGAVVPGVMTTNGCYNPASNIVVARHADMTYTPEDPWRSCRWDAHPSQLVVASRKDVSLVDMRAKTGQRCLFEVQTDEVVRAMQETEYSTVAPFQTYIVTSHQVACLDHRFTKRPLLSWAHHSDREQPCGIKCLDVDFGPDRYSTVVTWTRRNADITAYNVTRSNENSQPLQLMGRAQGLGSFHSHAQYTNSSSLRDSTSRYRFQTDDQGRLAQGAKPPLFGLDLLSSSVLEVDDEDQEIDDDTRHKKLRNSKKFSVIQYSYTGAVYAQELEILKKSELDSGRRLRVTRESILSNEYHDDQPSLSARTVSAEGNILVSDLTHQLNIAEQDLDPLDLMDQIVHATDGLCAPWKHGAKAAQSIADDPPLNPLEVRRHEDLDLTSFIKKLEAYLKTDFESSSRSREIDIQQKLKDAKEYDVLQKIKADHLPMADRETISQRIQEYIDHTPYLLHGIDFVHQKIIRTPLLPDSKLGELLEEKEPSQERITEALEDMYPLPATRHMTLQTPQESTDSISASLANLSIPGTRSSITVNFEGVDNQDDDRTQLWPTKEIQQARSQIIQRLSQNLYLSTITIFREPEVDPEPTQSSLERPKPKEMNLRYLVQESKEAQKVKIPAASIAILDEWDDQDPSKYVYRPPPSSKAAQNSDDDEPDEEEIRKHEEHLLKLRKRREQRTAYKGPTISAKGSASQPVMDGELTSSQANIPDEDGMFSLPTVISASQPVVSNHSRPKPKPKPKTKRRSIPSAIESLSQRSKAEEVPNRFSTQTPLFMDDSMFTASFASSSQDWESTLPLSQELPFSQGPVFFGAGGDSTSAGGISIGMSFGGTTHDNSQGGMMASTQQPASPIRESDMSGSQEMASMWMGASQPVPGAFATRRPITQKKKKKKKISTQGF